MFAEIGALQEGVVPDLSKPVTYDSLVEQYEAQARKACQTREQPESNWRMYAEIWAGMDMEIIRDVLAVNQGRPQEEVLRELFGQVVL